MGTPTRRATSRARALRDFRRASACGCRVAWSCALGSDAAEQAGGDEALEQQGAVELARRHLGAVAGVGHEKRVAILRGTREEGGCEQHRDGGCGVGRRPSYYERACRRGAEAGGYKPWCGDARNGAKGAECAEGWCRRGARAGVRRQVGVRGLRELWVGASCRTLFQARCQDQLRDASFACRGERAAALRR